MSSPDAMERLPLLPNDPGSSGAAAPLYSGHAPTRRTTLAHNPQHNPTSNPDHNPVLNVAHNQARRATHAGFDRSASVPYRKIGRSLSVVRDPSAAPLLSVIDRGQQRDIYLSTGGVLFAYMLERCTYFSIVGNLVLFCTNELGFNSTEAVTINLVFTGVAYMVPILAGRIADTIAGRFNTIYGCFLIYILGAVLLPTIAFNYGAAFGHDSVGRLYGLSLDWVRGYFVVGIIFVAIGAGGIKANISPFGAQQVEPLGQEAVHSFFNWFYWFVNIGGCIAYLGVVYVQQEIGFFLGYLIPALTLAGALIIFLVPYKVYAVHSCTSVFGFIASLLWEATCRFWFNNNSCCSCCQDNGNTEHPEPPLSDSDEPPPSHDSPDGSPVECPNDFPDLIPLPVVEKPIGWLDASKVSCGGSFADVDVENLKCLMRTIPIFMTLILFATFIAQNTTTMLLQGVRMNPLIGSFVIPAATLNIFKMGTIVVVLPLLDQLVYPMMHRYNRRPTVLQRMGFGMLAGVLSLVCMGILEMARKAEIAATGGRLIYIGDIAYQASDISILWQIPQFLLTGFGEAFTLSAAMEFSYTESPVETQGVMMGTNHLTTGLGNLLASVIYNCVADLTAGSNPWLPNEINNGHLENYVFLLAAILFLNFLVFVLLARCYKYSHLGDVAAKSADTTQPVVSQRKVTQTEDELVESQEESESQQGPQPPQPGSQSEQRRRRSVAFANQIDFKN